MKIQEVKHDRKSLPTRGLKGSPQIWLQEKRERDAQLWDADTSNYWIVQNKLYDLNSFVDQHPGGKTWLTMTKGQDVTQFFITHHLNEDRARETLKKYYVGQTKNKVSRFSFEQNGLYRAVKRQVLKEMTVAEIQSESKSKKQAYLILSLLLVSIFLTAKTINSTQHPFLPYVFGSFVSLLLIGMIGIGHNFVHHKQNYFKYFFVVTGFTHNEWQTMHALSHHIYPNMELDYQAGALQPIGYFLRNKPANPFYTEILLILSLTFIQPINFILKFLFVPITKKRLPQFWYLIPTLVFFSFYIACGDWTKALKFHLFIYCLFGFIFNRVLFCGHRLQELWSEGAQRIEDFGQHTILSTNDTDTAVQGLLSYLFLAGFNVHTPHHFFPTADHSILPRILVIIDRICKQKGIKRFSTNRLRCFVSLSKGIVNRMPFIRK